MSDLNLKPYDPLYPMRVHPYEELLKDQNASVIDKINSIIVYLNSVGKLTSDVVKNWNTVYNWVMNDGLTTGINNKLEVMLAKGEFDTILNTVVTKIGDITTLTTTDKSNLTRAINEIVLKIGNLANLTTTDKSSLVNSVNEVNAQLSDIGINVKKLGAKGDGVTDDTQALNNACVNGGTVLVPDGTYMINAISDSGDNPTIGGILLPSNTTLILSPKATLKAITNANEKYSILRCKDAENVKVIGGTIQGDRATHTGTLGEWGYGIILNGAKNVVIENVTIKDCWGDGIILASNNTTDLKPCKNIIINNVISDNNRRQGISVLHVDGLNITNSTFSNTNGTLPESGIDFEPEMNNYVKNTIIDNCIFTGNNGYGISGNMRLYDIQVNNCIVNFNKTGGLKYKYSITGKIANSFFADNIGYGLELEACEKLEISNNEAKRNTLGGIYLINSKNNTVKNNKSLENGRDGIYLLTSDNNVIHGNTCDSNSQETHNSYSNIYLYDCDNNSLQSNTARQGTFTNKPQVGIYIVLGVGNYCDTNDCYDGGYTDGFILDGTTRKGLNNINKDGSSLSTNASVITPTVTQLANINNITINYTIRGGWCHVKITGTIIAFNATAQKVVDLPRPISTYAGFSTIPTYTDSNVATKNARAYLGENGDLSLSHGADGCSVEYSFSYPVMYL